MRQNALAAMASADELRRSVIFRATLPNEECRLRDLRFLSRAGPCVRREVGTLPISRMRLSQIARVNRSRVPHRVTVHGIWQKARS